MPWHQGSSLPKERKLRKRNKMKNKLPRWPCHEFPIRTSDQHHVPPRPRLRLPLAPLGGCCNGVLPVRHPVVSAAASRDSHPSQPPCRLSPQWRPTLWPSFGLIPVCSPRPFGRSPSSKTHRPPHTIIC